MHTDEEIGADKQRGEVDSDNGFKEEILEEVGCVDNDEDEKCWQVDCKDCPVC